MLGLFFLTKLIIRFFRDAAGITNIVVFHRISHPHLLPQ